MGGGDHDPVSYESISYFGGFEAAGGTLKMDKKDVGRLQDVVSGLQDVDVSLTLIRGELVDICQAIENLDTLFTPLIVEAINNRWPPRK